MRWSPASNNGGSPVTGYDVEWSDDSFGRTLGSRSAGLGERELTIAPLTNGVEHSVRVSAQNAVGAGPWATARSTPGPVPGAPTGLALLVEDRSLQASWNPPGDDGGETITGYRLQWRPGNDQFTDSDPTATVAGEVRSHRIGSLANGTTYYVRVRAINDVGAGPWPTQPASATPATLPGAPTGLALLVEDRSLQASWNPPGDDGGETITGYRLQWRPGNDQFTDSDPTATVAGEVRSHRIGSLANGTIYYVRVRAINDVGAGPWPTQPASATPAMLPGAPTGLALLVEDRSLQASWNPPGDDGSETITGYRLQWRPGNDQFTDSDPTATVAGEVRSHRIGSLVNGTTYYVRVRAINDVGAGPWPTQPASATPATLPGAPTGLALLVEDRSLQASWNPPGDDGGETITGYRLQWRPGNDQFTDSDPTATVAGEVRSHRIGSLANGTTYYVRVRAINDVGAGPWPTQPASATPATLPGAPREVVIEAGNQRLTVTWQPPADDGGEPLTGYLVQWKSGDEEFSDTERRATVTTLRHQITGLDNGTTYTVRVRAVSLAGTGSPASESGTPFTVPGAPASLAMRPGLSNLLASWDEPDDDGHSTITGYVVQWKSGDEEFSDTERRATVTAPRHQITGLAGGTEYTVQVAATNAAGTGPAIARSLTLGGGPGAPTSLVVTDLNQNLEVRWQPPDDTPLEISQYWVLWRGAGEVYDDSDCSHRRVTVSPDEELFAYIGPFSNGSSYDVRVVAVKDDNSTAVADATGRPVAIPARPEGLGAYSVDGGLHVAWDKPWDGGSAITGYRVQWKGAGQEYNETDRQASVASTATSYEITGLTNGSSYDVRVGALNANGSSRMAKTTGSPADAPGPPSSITVTFAGVGLSHVTMRLNWTAPTDNGASSVTGYKVSWRQDYNNRYHSPSSIFGLAAEILVPCHPTHNVCVDSLFFVRVSAANAQGVGPPIVQEIRPQGGDD